VEALLKESGAKNYCGVIIISEFSFPSAPKDVIIDCLTDSIYKSGNELCILSECSIAS
jgi:hypothetical protein